MLRPDFRISRRALLLAATSAACAHARAPREREEQVRLPLIYDAQGSLFIEARVGGSEPVRLILDTGASRSTLSTNFATRLGLPIRAGDAIEGSAGVVDSGQASAVLEVPGIGAQSIDFATYAFASYDPACVGILGYEFLSRAPFRIRYRERVLEWHSIRPPNVQPLELDGRIPRITARINGGSIDLRVDTGAAFPPGDDAYLNLTEAQADALGLTGQPVAVFSATGTGGSVLQLPVHSLASLEVGGVQMHRAFAIVQPRVGYFARDDAVGFLGNSVLDKLDPYFDYTRAAFAVGA